MARKKSSGDAVQFTLESAQRIASVVRAAEQTPSPTAPLSFARPAAGANSPQLQFAYYTATSDWNKVFFHGPTTTANTKKIMFTSGRVATSQAESLSLYYATGATAMCLNNFQFLPLVSTTETAAKMLVIAMKSAGTWRLVGASS